MSITIRRGELEHYCEFVYLYMMQERRALSQEMINVLERYTPPTHPTPILIPLGGVGHFCAWHV
jgi:hypothetical protein